MMTQKNMFEITSGSSITLKMESQVKSSGLYCWIQCSTHTDKMYTVHILYTVAILNMVAIPNRALYFSMSAVCIFYIDQPQH